MGGFDRSRLCRAVRRALIVTLAGALTLLGATGPLHADPASEWGVQSAVDYRPEVMVRMRDGVRLSTDVLLPKDSAAPYPTIMIRTPYPKSITFAVSGREFLHTLIDNGYAIVVQFERGTHASEGEFHFLSNARQDGHDTISWIVAQPWSNGKVGTYGCSSTAENQMALSAENHPAHKAMIAKAAGAGIGTFPGVTSQGLFYQGGIPEMEFMSWYRTWGYIHRPQPPPSLSDEQRQRLMQAYADMGDKRGWLPWEPAAWHLPSRDVLKAIGTPETDWDTYIQRTPGDPAWKKSQYLTASDNPRVPALIVNSWHDIGAYEVIKAFEHQQSRAPHQFLLMGPTGHCLMGNETRHTMVGQRDVGDARYAYDALYLKWFDYWLKDIKNDVLSRPNVEYYLSGSSQWRTAPAWPPVATEQKFYLSSTRGANSSRGDGSLEAQAPRRAASDMYRYDPAAPVPTVSRYFDATVVADQKRVADRQDVLVYTSAPLQQDVDVVGEVSARLFVSTSVKDTDLMLRLVDVYPDGRAFNVGDAVLRLRYRNGVASPELMTPRKIYPIDLKGIVTATRFPAGHRIRVQITSSNFPMLERNLNTGTDNWSEVNFVTAETRIHHGGKRASYLSLPVVMKSSEIQRSAASPVPGRFGNTSEPAL